MKYAIRRLIAGVIAIPVVAGTYTAFYLFLILAGGEPTMTLTETFNTGVNIAISLAISLAFYPQISRLLDKVLA